MIQPKRQRAIKELARLQELNIQVNNKGVAEVG